MKLCCQEVRKTINIHPTPSQKSANTAASILVATHEYHPVSETFTELRLYKLPIWTVGALYCLQVTVGEGLPPASHFQVITSPAATIVSVGAFLMYGTVKKGTNVNCMYLFDNYLQYHKKYS